MFSKISLNILRALHKFRYYMLYTVIRLIQNPLVFRKLSSLKISTEINGDRLILYYVFVMEESTLNSSKKQQYAELHAELAKLNKNMENLGKNLKDTAEKVPSFRQMGTFHSSLAYVNNLKRTKIAQ
ncbi:hypothetical protein BD770DRAFT_409965 [Pilaira anomala]|nr:hypothetical protein BD770DRAFT_409965 [Pilaira anomala]